jgi:beta-N-acetylhexosaminidase
MTSHVYNARLQNEADEVPFTLSRSGIAGTLRGKLGFDGVVITDDMQMRAIEDRYSLADSVVRAVRAGNDLLLFANERNPDLEIPEKVISILERAAEDDVALKQRIRQSFERVMRLKAGLADMRTAR